MDSSGWIDNFCSSFSRNYFAHFEGLRKEGENALQTAFKSAEIQAEYQSRVKTPDSIKKKLIAYSQQNNIDENYIFANVRDFVGIRAILKDSRLYSTASEAIRKTFDVLFYKEMTEAGGYSGTNFTVKLLHHPHYTDQFEIQLLESLDDLNLQTFFHYPYKLPQDKVTDDMKNLMKKMQERAREQKASAQELIRLVHEAKDPQHTKKPYEIVIHQENNLLEREQKVRINNLVEGISFIKSRSSNRSARRYSIQTKLPDENQYPLTESNFDEIVRSLIQEVSILREKMFQVDNGQFTVHGKQRKNMLDDTEFIEKDIDVVVSDEYVKYGDKQAKRLSPTTFTFNEGEEEVTLLYNGLLIEFRVQDKFGTEFSGKAPVYTALVRSNHNKVFGIPLHASSTLADVAKELEHEGWSGFSGEGSFKQLIGNHRINTMAFGPDLPGASVESSTTVALLIFAEDDGCTLSYKDIKGGFAYIKVKKHG